MQHVNRVLRGCKVEKDMCQRRKTKKKTKKLRIQMSFVIIELAQNFN